MLAQLIVNDIVLIDRLGIDFDAGLTVLTGETGAGKSILLDALSLALGARGDVALVRSGAERGQITAVFEPPADHPAWRLLVENGIDADGALILKRTQTRDGKTRAFINDQPCGVALLRAVGSTLVEIHGQHDDRALVGGDEHRRLLDAFGRLEPDAEAVGMRWRETRRLHEELATVRAAHEAAEREIEFLRAAAEELEQLAPEPGEEAQLADRRQFLMKAEKAAVELSEALESVSGDRSPVPELAALSRRLERKSADMPGLLEAAAAALNAALDSLDDVRAGLEQALRACDFDPAELERVEERLFALRAAGRKYRSPVDDLATVAASYAARVADADLGAERIVRLEAGAAEAHAAYRRAANILSERRGDAAIALAEAVNAELPALRLAAARFDVRRSRDDEAIAADGFDRIAFEVQTNPGSAPGPLLKVASGGELSRFLLALKVALADRGSAPTLVFDEIDSGAGGAVAEAIGRRLARLAERVQVLAVTHAPQVAAHAAQHLLISKPETQGGRVQTMVEPVAGAARREEIARMLAGATISEEARAAATRLMEGAAA